MSHFYIATNSDGSVQQIYKDGKPHGESVQLEQLQAIVTIYFRLARANLELATQETERQRRRELGLQSFLMSLTGLEAFTNTYFHLRGRELNDTAVIERVNQKHGSLSNKISELVALGLDTPLVEQEALIERIFELSQLRNEIVHPRWEPASMTLQGGVTLLIDGLVQNFQSVFENPDFCRESLLWCLLVLARVAEARGDTETTGMLFHWGGHYGLSLDDILAELNSGSSE